MKFYLLLPLVFLKFWFLDVPISIFLYFSSLNKSVLKVLSLPLLVKTYFKPWKNEYREGLVGFSIGMGIFIKTFVILADLVFFLILLSIELLLILLIVVFPIVVFSILFI